MFASVGLEWEALVDERCNGRKVTNKSSEGNYDFGHDQRFR